MTAIPRTNGAGQPQKPQRPGGGDQGADLTPHLERLKPVVLEAFADDDVSKLPRPQLAIRMGEIVTVALDQGDEHVDLLTRRLVVTELISWLLQAGPSGTGPMSPGGGGEEKQEVYTAKKKKTTPLPTVEKAREKIQPIVLERIDVTAATKLPRDELGMQIGDILKEVAQQELKARRINDQ